MLAGELALAGADVAIVERRASQDVTGSRAGGLHSRTIEVLDQRGIAGRFLAQGTVSQVVNFSRIPLDIGDFPTRHPYGLGLWQEQIERIAEAEMDEPEWGNRRDGKGLHYLRKLDGGGRARVLVREQHLGQTGEPTLRDLSRALIAVWGTTPRTCTPRSAGKASTPACRMP
jgi:2-polyprenyl-6-methoxyphenol hydroxylase-like FAD-dependent oxidoreductase